MRLKISLEHRIREIVRARTPKGWRVYERVTKGFIEGRVWLKLKKIECPPLNTRFALCIFLHEVGHIALGHFIDDERVTPIWREEWEADRWATSACRSEGIAVPHEYTEYRRECLRDGVEKAWGADKHAEIDADVLRFAYPDTWRKVA